MSSSRDRIIEIFIEESTEVIETLESEIIALEEATWDKSIINEIFRGVHTLKGNANSFGFLKLGGFVHYFEDLLDFYRDPNHQLDSETMQLIYDAYDVIKEVFQIEKNGNDEDFYPENYHQVLGTIKAALGDDENLKQEKATEEVVVKNHFHHEKFDIKEIEKIPEELRRDILDKCDENSKVYNVTMEFDEDLYARGYNHTIFFKLFENLGEVVKSFWYISKNTPSLESFDTDTSYIRKVSAYLISTEPLEEIEDVFEFIAEENEVAISIVDCDLFSLDEQDEILGNDLISDTVPGSVEEEVTKAEDIEEPEQKNPESNNNKPAKAKQVLQSKSIRIESLKLDELFDSIGELVIAQSFIDQNTKIKALNDIEINQYLSMLNKTTRLIQNKVMNLRMVPIRDTFLKMKRVARDVSKKTGKDIELILSGEETEIDKTMVDSLSEPLIHLIRNSIDHGIEDCIDTREKASKEKVGKINLSAMHKGSNFIIEIKDDGKGIDHEAVLQKAISKGLASSEDQYTNEEIYSFLFMPGFSTAAAITDVSGRGVGLDAVKKSIEDLKGKIQVESKIGKGSTFRIVLPLTLAIIDGMSVRVKNDTFIIPTLSVVESFRAKKGEIQKAKGKGEFINFRGDILPIIKLGELLEIDDSELNEEETTLICIEHERGRYVLQVNELLGRQQVVIKSLSKKLARVKEISGAAIMGSGDIALILNVEGIRDWLDIENTK